MSLPPVAPQVVAAAVESLPARLRSRLDAMVEQAKQWPVTPTSDGGAEVTVDDVKIFLRVPVDAPEKATCTCLLAPKCLHRAAILSCAPILDAEQTAAPPDETEAPQAMPVAAVPLAAAEKAAAHALWDATIPLLEKGIDGADAIAQADLLRAVHGARQAGLHRPSAAATAVVRRVRAARARDTSFRLGELADDLRELLMTCHQLSKDDSAGRGRARRDYEPVGDLRLYGLLCEPLLTASGYAGAATILADEGARIWTVAEVRPGEGDRVRLAAEGTVEIGEIRISHRELSRSGLLTPGAVASADGRLSHGRKVQAVQSAGCDWYKMPVLKLWQTGIADQLARWLDALRLPVTDRPGGHDLAFLDGTVAGAGPRGLLMAIDGVAGPVSVAAPWEDPSRRTSPTCASSPKALPGNGSGSPVGSPAGQPGSGWCTGWGSARSGCRSVSAATSHSAWTGCRRPTCPARSPSIRRWDNHMPDRRSPSPATSWNESWRRAVPPCSAAWRPTPGGWPRRTWTQGPTCSRRLGRPARGAAGMCSGAWIRMTRHGWRVPGSRSRFTSKPPRSPRHAPPGWPPPPQDQCRSHSGHGRISRCESYIDLS